MAEPSGTFCVLPWLHLFADERGEIYPCCFSHRTPVTDANGARISADQPGALAKAWSSPVMREMRRQMLAGERPAACASCFQLEDLGAPSYRTSENADYAALIPELLQSTAADGTAPQRYHYVDLRLGNVCNVKCRMCSPQASRLLIEDFRAIKGLDQKNDWLLQMAKLDWFESPEFWNTLCDHLPTIDRLHFAGGEPLVIRQGFDFLRRIVALREADHIDLTYNTNTTVLPPEVYELWPHFKSVTVTASIDGTDAVNHYIRYPTKWTAVERVLRTLEREHAALNVKRVEFHATVQMYNVLGLTDLFRYLFDTCTFADPFARMDLVTNWPGFDIQILPRALKQLASERFAAFATELRARVGEDPRLPHFLARIDAVDRHMHARDASALIPEFRRVTAIYDERRRERLADVVPELAPLMDPPTPWQRLRARVATVMGALER
jgi:hypothetical protein